jgi:hypothetical protein
MPCFITEPTISLFLMSIQIVGPVTIFIIVRIAPTIAIYMCTAIY